MPYPINTMVKSNTKKTKLLSEIKSLRETIKYERRVQMYRVDFGYILKEKIEKKAEKFKEVREMQSKIRDKHNKNICPLGLLQSKEKLKKFKKRFSNDDFMILKNKYVQYKLSEKDKEIERLKRELRRKEAQEKSVKSRIDYMELIYPLDKWRSGELINEYNYLRRAVGLGTTYRWKR